MQSDPATPKIMIDLKALRPDPKHKADTELLFKGVLCTLIGLGVVISPMFMAASSFRSTVAGASLIGWFALVLGCALTALYARHRLAAARRANPAAR